MIAVIKRFKPDIVHTHTPKAGLIGMVAAWLCGVKVRMHTVAGLPVMESKGFKRWLLLQTERLTYACATTVYPNSAGLKKFINTAISTSPKISIIGKGSTNGIDASYFQRTDELMKQASALRAGKNLKSEDILFSFVGRIVKDKGIGELIQAFRKLSETGSRKCWLVLVGPFEQELDGLNKEDYDFLHRHPGVILTGFQQDVRPWIIASDVFVFPSYREGFPNVVLQACCLETCCVVSDINGCNEIIEHHKTGLIVKPKDPSALYQAMLDVSGNARKRQQFAEAARTFVMQNYDQQYVWQELLNEYTTQLNLR
jgi:glycosyltransferase involved in cell wall biosynthesis